MTADARSRAMALRRPWYRNPSGTATRCNPTLEEQIDEQWRLRNEEQEALNAQRKEPWRLRARYLAEVNGR